MATIYLLEARILGTPCTIVLKCENIHDKLQQAEQVRFWGKAHIATELGTKVNIHVDTRQNKSLGAEIFSQP